MRVARVYDHPEPDGGTRVLVDRLWPRGLGKEDANLDHWCRDVAPSTELRRWYGHDPTRFEEFADRYRAELDDPALAGALASLRDLSRDKGLTLLTATKLVDLSHATVLADVITALAAG